MSSPIKKNSSPVRTVCFNPILWGVLSTQYNAMKRVLSQGHGMDVAPPRSGCFSRELRDRNTMKQIPEAEAEDPRLEPH